jgi:hypothetical protein
MMSQLFKAAVLHICEFYKETADMNFIKQVKSSRGFMGESEEHYQSIQE